MQIPTSSTVRWSASMFALSATFGLLSGCGRSAEEARAERAAARERQQQAAVTTPRAPVEADYVAAVAAGNAGQNDLKFRLQDRPQVGQPLTIELLLAPQAFAGVSKLQLSLHTEDGLRVESSDLQQLTPPASGDALRTAITLTPLKPGIYNLSATLLLDSAATSTTRTYHIPLIVI